MPVSLDPQGISDAPEAKDKSANLESLNFAYDYPRNLNLKPGSDKHDKIVSAVRSRAQRSHDVMAARHKTWNRHDRVLKAYVEPAPDTEGSDNTLDQIVMPVSYATLQTLLTYMTSAFLERPIFKYEGTGPEDVLGAILMQQVIDHHVRKNQIGLALQTMWRDAFVYGIGVAAPTWKQRYGKRVERRPTGFLDSVRNIFFADDYRKRTTSRKLLFEGNDLENIDPYRYLPDPNTSAHEVQEGEFVGYIDRTNIFDLLSRERDDDDLFNIKYVKAAGVGKSSIVSEGQDRRNKEVSQDVEGTSLSNPVDTIEMYMDIIPSEWGVGSKSHPEKWKFSVAGDEVLVEARPVGLNHGKFPIVACAPDFDGYSNAPASRLDMVEDLQALIDFLYTSHVANVRKVINDMLVVDPQLVNIHDVNSPGAGKVIRMRRAAWGRGAIDEGIKQLEVADVTQGHVEDTMFLRQFMQNVTGATDVVQGTIPRRTSRISASEIQGSRSSALSRLEKDARIIDMQAHMPLAHMFASHTQQLMDEDTYLKVAGELEKRIRKDFESGQQERIRDRAENSRLKVNPIDMVVDYDLIGHSGSVPGAENAQLWTELFQILGQSPALAQQFDLVQIFQHIARQMGAKNVDDFVRQSRPQVRPDSEVEEAARRGDLQPVPQGNGQVPTNGTTQ